MRDLAQFFSYLNDIDFEYVVLRNWENLPYDVKVGPHSDLDLLVYDFEHFREVFGDKIEIVHDLPRVQHKIPIGDSYILCDVRHVGDNYYPYEFQLEILKSREWNKRGFFTPNPVMHRVALSYHAVHHKGFNSYERYLGTATPKELLESLKKSSIGWVAPDDPTVGAFHPYHKGATSIVSLGDGTVEKKQYRFKNHDLIANEARILRLLSGENFPKIISHDETTLKTDDCGESLRPENLPENWKEQLIEIILQLKTLGIVHRDIRLDNLMVKDEVIKLIDFGWARLASEEDGKTPDLLGYPNKSPYGFDDAFSMKKVMRQLDYELEEVCVS
jgi:serine/threonine protein kinase